MANQSWFGFLPHLSCLLFGVLLFSGGIWGTDFTASDRAVSFLSGTAAAALGLGGWAYSSRDYRSGWMSAVAATSWMLGVAFVLLVAFVVWFTLTLLKGLSDNLGGR